MLTVHNTRKTVQPLPAITYRPSRNTYSVPYSRQTTPYIHTPFISIQRREVSDQHGGGHHFTSFIISWQLNMMVLTRILLQTSFAKQCSKSQLSHLLCHLCLYCCCCRRRSGFLLRLLCPVFPKVGLSQLGPLQNCHLSLWLQCGKASTNASAQTCQRSGPYCRERASCFNRRISCCHFLFLPFSHGISHVIIL